MEIISYPKEVKARKKHTCDWCCQPIEKGEIYNFAVYKNDEIYPWRSHIYCIKLIAALNMEGDDFDECITEAFRECVGEDYVLPSFKEQVEMVYSKYCK